MRAMPNLTLTVAMYVKKPLTSSILMGLSGPGLAIENGMLYFNIKMMNYCASVICLHVVVATFIS